MAVSVSAVHVPDDAVGRGRRRPSLDVVVASAAVVVSSAAVVAVSAAVAVVASASAAPSASSCTCSTARSRSTAGGASSCRYQYAAPAPTRATGTTMAAAMTSLRRVCMHRTYGPSLRGRCEPAERQLRAGPGSDGSLPPGAPALRSAARWRPRTTGRGRRAPGASGPVRSCRSPARRWPTIGSPCGRWPTPGYADVWAGEADGADAVATLAAVAAWEPRLHVGTAVVPGGHPRSRAPRDGRGHAGRARAGRVPRSGSGASSAVVVEGWNAVPYDRPYARTRDVVRFLRRALAGRAASTSTRPTFSVDGFRLGRPADHAAARPRGRARPGHAAPRRPRGRRCRAHVLLGRRRRRRGRRRSARRPPRRVAPEPQVVAWVTVCPTSTHRRGGPSIRCAGSPAVASPATSPRRRTRRSSGRAGGRELLAPLWDAWAAGDRRGAVAAIPDVVVDDLVVHGAPADCHDAARRASSRPVSPRSCSRCSPAPSTRSPRCSRSHPEVVDGRLLPARRARVRRHGPGLVARQPARRAGSSPGSRSTPTSAPRSSPTGSPACREARLDLRVVARGVRRARPRAARVGRAGRGVRPRRRARCACRRSARSSWARRSCSGAPTSRRPASCPRSCAAESVWCQGFSEPGAGSDLAGVATRAERSDDGTAWIVTGEKIWTSEAEDADFMILLARTDPASRRATPGISYLLMPMQVPGISFFPIAQIDGTAGFNRVVFDGARCPVDNVVGPVDGGWKVAMSTLGFERGASTAASYHRFRRDLDGILATAAELRARRRSPGAATARAHVDRRRAHAHQRLPHAHRVVAGSDRSGAGRARDHVQGGLERARPAGDAPRRRPAGRRRAWCSPAPTTTCATPRSGSVAGCRSTATRRARCSSRSCSRSSETIYGGTSEIQRNVVGRACVLGLPRDPR